MITNVLIGLCAIVILIGIIYGLMIVFGIVDNPFSLYRDAPDDYDYHDPDDDNWDDDDDDDDDLDGFFPSYPVRVYAELTEPHLIASEMYGDATEYTVEHVRKLLEMEDDAIEFMNKQDVEVAMYLAKMAA